MDTSWSSASAVEAIPFAKRAMDLHRLLAPEADLLLAQSAEKASRERHPSQATAESGQLPSSGGSRPCCSYLFPALIAAYLFSAPCRIGQGFAE